MYRARTLVGPGPYSFLIVLIVAGLGHVLSSLATTTEDDDRELPRAQQADQAESKERGG